MRTKVYIADQGLDQHRAILVGHDCGASLLLPRNTATYRMRYRRVCACLLLSLLFTSALKPVKIGKKGKKAIKIVSEAGLGVMSLTATLGILNSLEKSMDPDDGEMSKLIEAERKRLLGLGTSAWQSPWPWTGGFAGLSTLALILYLIRMMRNRQTTSTKQKEPKEPSDQGTTTVIFSAARKDEEIQFGDIRMSP